MLVSLEYCFLILGKFKKKCTLVMSKLIKMKLKLVANFIVGCMYIGMVLRTAGMLHSGQPGVLYHVIYQITGNRSC